MSKPVTNQPLKEINGLVRAYNAEANFELIRKAYFFAGKAHQGQKRLSGEEFLAHPVAVAKALAQWRLDSVSLVAGLLHDTVEDGGVRLETIKKEFGEDAAMLVAGVTKISEIRLRGSGQEEMVENLRKMIVYMAKDLRVVLIKLADRYHNMKTLSALPPENQLKNARETLEVYAPLAERLGIGEMKGQLEDLAFPYVYPEDYRWVKKFTAPYFNEARGNVEKTKKEIQRVLAEKKVKAQVSGRAKHLYSLWRKLNRPEIDKDIRKIHDLVALRIIVASVRDCYAALGIVHGLYRPLPGELSDFIAQPKPNGYRSIHTKVFGRGGQIIEIQIRTRQMHEVAERGIAAHWYYSLEKAKSETSDSQIAEGFFAPNEKMAWVAELVKWQKEVTDSQEFINSLKFDALKHRNFIFSPNGDVYDLPAEATPVDFAYAVHTWMGNQCAGAKVNGKLVSLSYQLRSGEVVEIISSRSKKRPSPDWLDFVVTRKARTEIAKSLRRS